MENREKLIVSEKVNRDTVVPLCSSWYQTTNVIKQATELKNTL
jgi:hypothetical protein